MSRQGKILKIKAEILSGLTYDFLIEIKGDCEN